jgi:signal transduction histidine kinase
VLETGLPYQAHNLCLHPRRTEEAFYNVLISPLVDRSGTRLGVIQIMEDVTRETRMEAEMSRIRRLADIGQLAAKMAHEVRNPLSSIKGAAQLMRNESEEMSGLREFLDIIIEEVNGLSKITTDLLDFARPMQLDLHETSLNDLVTRGVSFLSTYAADHRVRISVCLDDDMPSVTADPTQIEQVLRNVVLNAVQAMPDGGDVVVRTFQDAGTSAVGFSVTDGGVGIPEDRLSEVFQPFHTTKTKGSGLGLCIVSKIVNNHGGLIDVSSRVGEGSTFTISLPIRPASGAPPSESSEPRPVHLSSALPDV